MWRFASPEKRLPVLCGQLQRLSPDAVAVQECSPDQAEALSDALGMEAHYVGAPLGRGGAEMGNAVLARASLTDRTHRWLPMVKAEDMRRVAVAARLDCDGAAVWLVSIHLTRTPDAGEIALGLTRAAPGELAARSAQIAELGTFVDTFNEPAVVAGDLAFPARLGRIRPIGQWRLPRCVAVSPQARVACDYPRRLPVSRSRDGSVPRRGTIYRSRTV